MTRWPRVGLMLGGLVVCAAAAAERVELPAPHLGGQALAAQFFAPTAAAPGRRPAVVMLHGCGGIGAGDEPNARHRMWADWLVERGHAVLLPLSFSSRGLGPQCTVAMRERTIRPQDRVADALAAQAWLASRPDIDPSRIVLWGFSHGGSTTLATVTAGAAAGRFSQAIAFYPGCSAYARAAGQGERMALAAPLQIFIGEADDWTPAAPCHAWVGALRRAGQPADIVGYPGAFHDFDNPAGRLRLRTDVPNGVNPGRGVTVGPDPVAREDAKRRIAALLARVEPDAPAPAQPATAPR